MKKILTILLLLLLLGIANDYKMKIVFIKNIMNTKII